MNLRASIRSALSPGSWANLCPSSITISQSFRLPPCISKALKEEGVDISPTQIHGIPNDLGLSYKRPKLTVESNDPPHRRKEREIRRYERVAPALEKGGFS